MTDTKKGLQFHDILFFVLLVVSFYFTRNTLCSLLMMAFFGYTLLRMLLNRKKITFPFFLFGFLVFIAYGFISIYVGDVLFPSVARTMAVSLTLNAMMIFAVLQYVLMQEDIFKILRILEFSILTTALVVVLLSLGTITQGRLASGTEMNANMLSMLCVYGFILTIYLYKIQKIVFASFLAREIFYLVSILLTGSRKGLIMVVLALVLINVVGGTKKLIRGVVIGAVAVVILYVLVMNVPLLYDIMGVRIESLLVLLTEGSTDEGSLENRQELVEIGLAYIKERPWTGYGLDCFKMITGFGTGGNVGAGQAGYYSHNNYVELLFGVGIVGLVLFYIPILSLLKKILKNLKKHVCVRYLFAILVTKLAVEYAYVSYYNRMDAYLLAIILGCAILVQRNQKTEKEEKKTA